MLKSMTGFGAGSAILRNQKIIIEIRTLNSKQLDISLRLPAFLSEREYEIRNQITRVLERGKVNVVFSIERGSEPSSRLIDKDLAMNYFREVLMLARETNFPEEQVLSLVMRMPDLTRATDEALEEVDWQLVLGALSDALNQVDLFREKEGDALEKDLRSRIETIKTLAVGIGGIEANRTARLREKITQELLTAFRDGEYDKGRFEQEMIFYLERLDITEERVRLASHCEFFLQTLGENASGRKLGFISQEMGREINTIGSKANDLEIQRMVVLMKDELEKVKEQLLNIL